MTLPIAMSLGIIAALARSLYHRQPPTIPDLHQVWLVFAGFLPQYVVFFLPGVREQVSTPVVAFTLVGSLCLLAIFTWINRQTSGFWLLGIGLLLNLLVIAANGGLMPISPETIARLSISPDYIEKFVEIGSRFDYSKDIVLLKEDTWFWWLSDVLVLPNTLATWRRFGVAFSVGDVFVALGAIWFFWQSGARDEEEPAHMRHSRAAL